ncbi:hypothetical protein TRFO_40871 [Tritrichomonas foetus]|uniref:Uncharacterized protein n=1 Tax=Tritrichomonas foetus TaxID=1144522 RepID=A0A1J4J579_9EUKA|nr:hypothetical protein TRFO_40871 [Tritrichomonas foetus]|eukprot:OHS92811.1 hypothetical protein TRFO_40871 [Tritrichomonas foetus]
MSGKRSTTETPKETPRSNRQATAVSKKSKEPNPEIIEISNELLNGAPTTSVDPCKAGAVYSYLRKHKQEVLKKPDYFLAQRIDDVCSELMLLSSQTSYCEYRGEEIAAAEEKLEQAKNQLQLILDEREKVNQLFNNQKAKNIEKLEQQQQEELEQLEQKYNSGIPPKFKKVSNEVLNIRKQEEFLRNSKRYMEAQQLKEEADALEAFELARQEVKYHNEKIEAKEKLMAQHQTQMKCLLEKMNRQYNAMMPNSYDRENHWKSVIGHLEVQIRRLRGDKREVKKVTQSMLTKERGLPSLGKKVPQSPMTRVTTVNNQRAYTRYGTRRPKSSFQ